MRTNKRMCPGLICVLAQHEKYVDYHHRIIAEVQSYLPVDAVCSIDEVACRLMDNENSIPRSTELALAIKQGLAKNVGEYIKCSIGIAPNRYLAKVATDLKKPDGFTILQAHDLPHKLYSLKLRDLPGIGRNMEKRILMAGIGDMQSLLQLPADRMRRIWGSVWGEKMWHLLRGADLPEEETTRSTIGHSHVMAPELREPAKAKFVARRLTLKAASRLRRLGYYASHLSVSARTESGPRVEAHLKCYRAQDSFTFIHLLDAGWKELTRQAPHARFKKVSVTLHGLTAADTLEPELFDALPDVDVKKRSMAERISHALDKINHRFGRDSVLVGMLPSQGRSFSGTKIAFTRIPDVEEFLE